MATAAPVSAQQGQLHGFSLLELCTADISWDLLDAVVLKYNFPLTRLFLPFLLENRRITDPKFNPNLNSLTPISF